jgi:hypothetical protein
VSSGFPDLERDLAVWAQALTGVPAGSVAPGTIPAGGFIRVVDISGTDDSITASPSFEFSVFHPVRGTGWQISDTIRGAVKPRTRVGAAIIDSVRTSASPRQVPWDNTNTKRFSATYMISVRRV